MNSPRTNHMTGIERVLNLQTQLKTTESIFLVHQDLITLLKKRFYYLESKITVAKDGKKVAITRKVDELELYTRQAKSWVELQTQAMTNFESMQFDVLLVHPVACKLLRTINLFDQVMTQLAAASFAGGQNENLRQNYFFGFSKIFNDLFEISSKSEPHFHSNGAIRENSDNLSLN